ncbi:MAG: hypothetical protein KDJ52_09645 [Anaerolineae bacterium]|nr:hypothetical protein [Anaerolineae bacterium]
MRLTAYGYPNGSYPVKDCQPGGAMGMTALSVISVNDNGDFIEQSNRGALSRIER